MKLTWVGTPARALETKVTRADAPKVLEYRRYSVGTRSLWWRHAPDAVDNIDRRFISMGAAGWHIASMFWIAFSAELRSAASLAVRR